MKFGAKYQIIVTMILLLLYGCAPDLSRYDYLLTPQINKKTNQKMLVYTVKGNPNEVSGEAIKALYQAFFKLKKEHDLKMKAPLARWPQPFDTPMDEWIGIFGLPISESVTKLPEKIREQYPKLTIDVWEYGEVAEILHIGSYSSEDATIDRLHQFINDNGFKISGYHEEEYLKGPGMFGKGNPDKYRTIIRYNIEKI